MTPPPRLKSKRIGDLRWSVRVDWPTGWWREVLNNPEAWLKDPRHIFKDSRNVTVTRVPSPIGTFPNLVLRRIKYGRVRQQFRDLFRRSRAQRALRRALALEAAGVRVSGGVAAADVRRYRWPVRGYLLTVEIPQARTLTQIVRQEGKVPRGLEVPLADLLAQLHSAGFTHGDLKATNILLVPGGEPWFIDYDGVRQFKQVTRVWALKDLVRFGKGINEAGGTVGTHAAGRFLERYCHQRNCGDWRDWFRAAAPRFRTQAAKAPPTRELQGTARA